jgi:hypothetical protein
MKYQDTIKYARFNGCYFNFETNKFVYASGREISPKLYGKQRYPSINLSYGSFPLHKFVAYQLYGDIAFKKIVRHLDGNVLNLSKSNIVLGTHSENNLDKPKHKRIAAAKKARASQKRSYNAKLSMEIAIQIRYGFKNQKLSKHRYCNEMARQLDVSISTIYAILAGRLWNECTINKYNA